VIQSLIVSIITKNQCKPTYVTLLHYTSIYIYLLKFLYIITLFSFD